MNLGILNKQINISRGQKLALLGALIMLLIIVPIALIIVGIPYFYDLACGPDSPYECTREEMLDCQAKFKYPKPRIGFENPGPNYREYKNFDEANRFFRIYCGPDYDRNIRQRSELPWD